MQSVNGLHADVFCSIVLRRLESQHLLRYTLCTICIFAA